MWRICLLLESMEDLVYRSDAVLKIAKDSERIWARENIPYFDILGKIKNRFRGERQVINQNFNRLALAKVIRPIIFGQKMLEIV